MQRHLLGITAIVLMTAGAVAYGMSEEAAAGVCWRIGGMLALVWLALPQLASVPTWLMGVLVVALLVVVRWPKLLLAALPLAVVLWLLRPRAPRRRETIADSND